MMNSNNIVSIINSKAVTFLVLAFVIMILVIFLQKRFNFDVENIAKNSIADRTLLLK